MASLTQLSQLLGCPFTSLDDWLAQVTPSVVSAKQQQLDPLPHFSPQQHLEQKSREAHESRPDQLDSNSQQNSELSCQVNTGTQLPSGSVLQHGQASNPPQHMGGGAQPCDASSLLSEGSSQLRQHQLVSLAAFAAAAAGQVSIHALQQQQSSQCTVLLLACLLLNALFSLLEMHPQGFLDFRALQCPLHL